MRVTLHGGPTTFLKPDPSLQPDSASAQPEAFSAWHSLGCHRSQSGETLVIGDAGGQLTRAGQPERRLGAVGRGGDSQPAMRLPREAFDHGQAQTGAFADTLRGEKRFGHPAQDVAWDAGTVVADRDPDVATGLEYPS